MSAIRFLPFIGHFLGSATDYVIHLHRGRIRHSGVGQSFWFARNSSVLSEVPATDQELPSVLHTVSADQQKISVQTNVTFRFVDPVLASQRLDFTLFPTQGGDLKGRQHVSIIIGQLVQSVLVDVSATMTLEDALRSGIDRFRQALTKALPEDTRLLATGIAVLGVRVLAVRPEADIEKALQTPVRELLQSQADKAMYERRALAVERELAISANELASQIELANQRQELVAQEGANERREAAEQAAVAMIAATGEAERADLAARSKAAELSLIGEAQAAKEAAMMAVYADVGREVLLALALRDAASALPEIGNLTITPDLVSGLLSQLSGKPR